MSDIKPEVTDRLVAYLRSRTRYGDDKYGTPLLPFDGRHTLKDALEEATDLSQYLMKEVMEREAVVALLERASSRIDPHFGHTPEDVNGHPHPNVCATCAEHLFDEDGNDQWTEEQVEYWRSMDPMATELREMAQKLRQDIKRIEPEEA